LHKNNTAAVIRRWTCQHPLFNHSLTPSIHAFTCLQRWLKQQPYQHHRHNDEWI